MADEPDLNVDMDILAANSVLQGMAVGIVWVPLTVIAFATLDPQGTRRRRMALFHLLRNIGSSFFISICVAEIVRTTGENYSRMTEMVSPYKRRCRCLGDGRMDVRYGAGARRVAKEINRQAAMIGYVNAFAMYTVTSALAVAFVLMVRRRPRPTVVGV